ncbi:MAG: NIPSNAP family protein [Acidobacteria bacterium]|nr:MAG: NIPSNAP family protein [Acidobacteriota bacterium]
MITLCIRYEIDQNKHSDFEKYARAWPEPIRRCGGDLIGYFLPTKFAGPTNSALALISFPNLTAYEKYRDALTKDPSAVENVAYVEQSGCILNEERSLLQRVP